MPFQLGKGVLYSMRQVGRYSIGVGPGVLALLVLNGAALPEAATAAGVLVAMGWILWGLLVFKGEAGEAARFAFDAAGVLFTSHHDGTRLENSDHDEPSFDDLPAAKATRWVRVNDHNGMHWLALDGPQETPYRRRLVSFVALGERVGSWNFREVQGRALSDSTRIDYDLWRRFTHDLKGARLFESKRGVGTGPRVDTAHCLAELAAGAGLWSDPEIILSGERVV